MSHMEVTGTVEAPVHEVWEIVSDPESFSRWFPEITLSRVVNGETGVGAERIVEGDMMGEWRSRQRITVFRPEREVAWRHLEDTGKPGKFLTSVTHKVRLSPRGSGRTVVTLSGDFATKGMGTMMAPMIRMKMRKKYRTAIELLDGLGRVSALQAA